MEIERNRMISIHYDSILDLDIDYYLNHHWPNKQHFFSMYNRKENGSYWFGPTSNSLKKSYEHSLIGDHELYEKHLVPKINELNEFLYNKNFDNINIVPVVKRQRLRKDFGDELDIQYVLRGQLDKAWQTTKRIEQEQERNLITLIIDVSHASNKNCLDTLWVAAAALKICDDLQKSNKSVQIITSAYTRSTTISRKNMCMSFNIKKYNEHLTVERLAAMSHAGFFRSLCFLGMISCSEKVERELGYPELMTNKKLPIHIQDEIISGKTKVAVLDKCLNLKSAKIAIDNAYRQILENKDGIANI